ISICNPPPCLGSHAHTGGGNGSLLVDLKTIGFPMSPLSTCCSARAYAGSKRRINPTCSFTPRFLTVLSSRSACFVVIAIGFSTNTSKPSSAASVAIGACVSVVVTTQTASSSWHARAPFFPCQSRQIEESLTLSSFNGGFVQH